MFNENNFDNENTYQLNIDKNNKEDIGINVNNSLQGQNYQNFISESKLVNNNIGTNNKPKKKVRFNNKIDVIPVESYKEYNKIEDDFFVNEPENTYKELPNKKKKKVCDDCICYIS